MQMSFLCGRDEIAVGVPDDAQVYASCFPEPAGPASDLVLAAARGPIGSAPLKQSLAARREGDVVIAVSDITRPIPYAAFLPALLAEIESAGVPRGEILLLIATGMHRPSTEAERVEMFGADVAANYRIDDHRAEDEPGLAELPNTTWSGATVKLNRRFVDAGFRIVTGLVEPHFMAGFSGGRKSVCPGLASLDTVRNFHGEAFLSNVAARNGQLHGNPLHEEALSVARMVGVDFALNVVLDKARHVVSAFAGDLEAAHDAACQAAAACACRPVERPADVVLTSCGGYPLDATFYQCVKGMVGCLPAVREGGTIIVFGGCSEGVGSAEYAGMMKAYAGRWKQFLDDIKKPGVFVRDQWELQMQCRALAKVGEAGLHFVTDGLPTDELGQLSVTPHPAAPGDVASVVQGVIDAALAGGGSVAVFPEGPYCVAV
jgi:lactate racemase